MARIVSHNSGATEKPVLGDGNKLEAEGEESSQKDEKALAKKKAAASQEDDEEAGEEKARPKKQALA